jgi:hypothetical protein
MLSGLGAVAVATPPFAPPLAFFARWQRADLLVAGDTFAYSRRSAASRTRIQTPEGLLWLGVPVDSGQTGRPLHQVRLATHATDARLPWPRKLARTLRFTYGTAPFYAHYASRLKELFEQPHPSLAHLNVALLGLLAGWLGVTTPLVLASELSGAPPTEREVLDVLSARSPGAAVAETAYHEAPRYAHNGAFVPGLSALDALMAIGPEAGRL